MRFEWNPEKAAANVKKHGGVTFEEAVEIFYDANAVEYYDDGHTRLDETRFVRIGNSSKRLLRVSFTALVEGDDETVRIISARKAGTKEEEIYNEQN